jgi:hypothetical protein
MFGIGGGSSKSSNKSFISKDQLPFLKDVWGAGQSLYGSLPSAFQTGQQQLGQYAPYLQQGLQAYGGIASGQNPMMQNLMQRATGQSPYLQSQIDQLGADINKNLTQNILPGIGSGARLAGLGGSSRQGIAEGMALQGAQDAYGRGVSDLRFQDYAQGQSAANQYLAMQQAAAGGGIGGAGAGYNLGMAPLMGAFGPLLNYAQAIGGPAILSEGSSSGWNASGGFGKD